MQIRQAVDADAATIVEWRQERAAWLAERGTDQWSENGLSLDAFTERVQASISAGQTWIAEAGGTPVGTIAVDRWSDPDLWSPSELADALFIHRMITPLSSAGLAVSPRMLAFAEDLAQLARVNWLRLDAWTTNPRLHMFWMHSGFAHVRTMRTTSGALFQRPIDLATSAPYERAS